MIYVILLIALTLRLVAINQSLWLDEGINVIFAHELPFKELILNYSLGDFHPPLYHIVLKVFITIFGASEISARAASVILGTLTVYIIYLIGKKLYDLKTGLIAATLMATAPLHIYYSQEARMYAMAAFFVSLSVYFFLTAIEKDKIHLWVAFIVSTTLMLYTDYLPYLMIPAYVIYLFLNRKKIPKNTLLSFVPAFVLTFILLLPWLIIFPKQLHTGLSAQTASPAWASVVGNSTLKTLAITFVKFTIGRISANDNVFYFLAFAPVAIFTILLFILHLFRLSPKRSFLMIWLFVPVLVSFVISFFIPVFAYFRLLFVLGAFYLIWSSAIATVNWKILNRSLLATGLAVNLIAVSVYFLNPNFHRENWRAATSYIQNNSTPTTLVLFETNYTLAPFDYYNKGNVKALGILDNWSPTQEQVSQNIKEIARGTDKIYLFQYLSPITDPRGLVFEELTKQSFTNTQTKDFQGVGFIYEFKKF